MSLNVVNSYKTFNPNVGGWKEVGRTTLGSTGDIIDITSLPDKRYYHVLMSTLDSGAYNIKQTFNGDTGNNYADRFSFNDGVDSTRTNQANFSIDVTGDATPKFNSMYVSNLSNKEKLSTLFSNYQNTAGEATAPDKTEMAAKWANTTDAIDQFTITNTGAGDYAAGSEVVILGWDPDDTHSANFWEELGTHTNVSDSDNLDSGAFAAKKYLWIQAWIKNNNASHINAGMRFNGDAATNYASRRAQNGSPGTSVNQSHCSNDSGEASAKSFNAFVVNNSANEKLVIGHTVWANAPGAGITVSRREWYAKWDNLVSQITSVEFDNLDAGTFETGATVKVWGSN